LSLSLRQRLAQWLPNSREDSSKSVLLLLLSDSNSKLTEEVEDNQWLALSVRIHSPHFTQPSENRKSMNMIWSEKVLI